MIHLKKIKLCSELLKTIGMQMLICLGMRSKLSVRTMVAVDSPADHVSALWQAMLSYHNLCPGRRQKPLLQVKFLESSFLWFGILKSMPANFILLCVCEVIEGCQPSEKVGTRLAHFLVQWVVHQSLSESWLGEACLTVGWPGSQVPLFAEPT